MLKCLGLDPSLTSFGWSFLDGAAVCGTFRSKYRGVERLADLRSRLVRLIEHVKPDYAIVEGYAYAANRGHDQGEIGSIVRLALYDRGIPFDVITPQTLKKFCTGKGNAKKDQMVLAVYKRWGISVDTTDEADALALAKWGVERYDEKEVTQEKEVIQGALL